MCATDLHIFVHVNPTNFECHGAYRQLQGHMMAYIRLLKIRICSCCQQQHCGLTTNLFFIKTGVECVTVLKAGCDGCIA